MVRDKDLEKPLANMISIVSVKTIDSNNSSACAQGEQMALRLPVDPSSSVDANQCAVGTLFFADGSQKMLAAFSTWLGVLSLWEDHRDALQVPEVQSMLASFLAIPTCVKGSIDNSNTLEAAIGRIVKQNIDAKVLPVSSFQWSSVLRSLGQDVKLDQALQLHNAHPDVMAHDDSGSGSITLDNRKKQGVQNWYEKTCPEALEVVLKSTHDLAFSFGCFGESFSLCNFAFLGSSANLTASDAADLNMQPFEKEAFVSIVVWRKYGVCFNAAGSQSRLHSVSSQCARAEFLCV